MRKKFWVMLRCGPLDASTAESIVPLIRQLGPRRPSLFGINAGLMRTPRGHYLLTSAVRRSPSGKAACDAFTAEVRRVASVKGVTEMPIVSRSAVTVERQGWFGWVSGELVFSDDPGHPQGPTGDREPRVPLVPPDTLFAKAEPPPETP